MLQITVKKQSRKRTVNFQIVYHRQRRIKIPLGHSRMLLLGDETEKKQSRSIPRQFPFPTKTPAHEAARASPSALRHTSEILHESPSRMPHLNRADILRSRSRSCNQDSSPGAPTHAHELPPNPRNAPPGRTRWSWDHFSNQSSQSTESCHFNLMQVPSRKTSHRHQQK